MWSDRREMDGWGEIEKKRGDGRESEDKGAWERSRKRGKKRLIV